MLNYFRQGTRPIVRAVESRKRAHPPLARFPKAYASYRTSYSLPNYRSVKEIIYANFVHDLHKANRHKEFNRKEIDGALKAAMIRIVGRAAFQKMKESSGGAVAKNPWKRLMDEGDEYWMTKKKNTVTKMKGKMKRKSRFVAKTQGKLNTGMRRKAKAKQEMQARGTLQTNVKAKVKIEAVAEVKSRRSRKK